MIIQDNCLGLFFNFIVGTEAVVIWLFQHNIQFFIMLTMMERTCAYIQSNSALVLWNILVEEERRRVWMINPTENTFITSVNNIWGDINDYSRQLSYIFWHYSTNRNMICHMIIPT